MQVGYLSPGFGQSYAAFGTPVQLPNCGLQLLERPIGAGTWDYTGPYPYAMCTRWGALEQDIAHLVKSGAASVTFVADPFQADAVRTATQGWELCRHFKTHHVTDLTQDWRAARPKEMRRITRRALEAHHVETLEDPRPLAAQFWDLYQTTVTRHGVSGIQALSLDVIKAQLALPGGLVITARDEEGLTGALLSFCHGNTANLHLMFLSLRAHAQNTSYALIYGSLAALEARGVHYANLGGAAGASDAVHDSLARFKMGWATETRSALICGKILNASLYHALTDGKTDVDGYFPAYRAPGASLAPKDTGSH